MLKMKVVLRRTTMEEFTVEAENRGEAETIAQRDALTKNELRTFRADDHVEIMAVVDAETKQVVEPA